MKGKKLIRVLSAETMNEREADIFVCNAKKKRNRLMNSKAKFHPTCKKWIVKLSWDSDELKVQSEYSDVPLRDRRFGDERSTVATSGSAILVAKFLEIVLDQRKGTEKKLSVAEISKLAVKYGYKEYEQKEDGGYVSTGTKDVFWDRFVPSLYGFEVERATTIESMMESMKACGFPVVLVDSKIYDQSIAEDADKHFVVICGYDEEEGYVLVFDPMYPEQICVEYERVIPAIENAWIFYE